MMTDNLRQLSYVAPFANTSIVLMFLSQFCKNVFSFEIILKSYLNGISDHYHFWLGEISHDPFQPDFFLVF